MVPFKKKYSDIFMERESDDEFSPKIGSNHQAEIPLNLADSEDLYDKPLSSASCLPVSATWSDSDAESLVLGLFLFGKNFTLIKRFLETKEMGEILSFYYGKFYKTDGYRRWSECKKLKGRKCIIAKKLSTKIRQNDLLSRLIPRVSKESQHTLLEVSMSFVEGKTCLEEYISSMKSILGLGVFAEAVGTGKENGVLTQLDLQSEKNKRKVELKDASMMSTSDLLRESKGGSSQDGSPKIVGTKLLISGKRLIFKIGCKGVSNSGATSKSEAHEFPDKDANKEIKIQNNLKMLEEPLRKPCNVDSLDQQADTNPRRQSTRKRSLTVRALECITNEFLHEQKRQKNNVIQTRKRSFQSLPHGSYEIQNNEVSSLFRSWERNFSTRSID